MIFFKPKHTPNFNIFYSRKKGAKEMPNLSVWLHNSSYIAVRSGHLRFKHMNSIPKSRENYLSLKYSKTSRFFHT